jgi:hypothetical protein
MQNLVDSIIAFQNLMRQESIPVMAIGGIAVAVWGEPRLTRDVDFKVLISKENRMVLLNLLRGYTALQDDPDDSFRRFGLAFFQDPNGIRIDVMLADTIFDQTALERACEVDLLPGKAVRVCTAEDLIIYKMLSTRLRDRSDVESVIRRQGKKLDSFYIEKWLKQFEEALSDSPLVRDFKELLGR